MTPAIALANAARLLASHANDTIQCPAQSETALAVALDCLQQAAALSPDTLMDPDLLAKLTNDVRPAFSSEMLPILGVMWHYFEHLDDAMAFANWAEAETRDREHPCDAYVTQDDLLPRDSRFAVMVRNW